VSLGPSATNPAGQFGNAIGVPLGNRPAYPGKRPPYKPDEPCYRQKLPDVNGPAAAKSAPSGSALASKEQQSERDKLRKQTELEAVRRKLNPFGAKRRSLPEKPK
jgi:hypothetical protein